MFLRPTFLPLPNEIDAIKKISAVLKNVVAKFLTSVILNSKDEKIVRNKQDLFPVYIWNFKGTVDRDFGI